MNLICLIFVEQNTNDMTQLMKLAENQIDNYYKTLLGGGAVQIGKYLVIPIEFKTDNDSGVIINTEFMTEEYLESIRYIDENLAGKS